MSHYKPYPVSKDSGVVWLGWVPENWTIGPYKAMIQIENGSDYKAVEADDGYPVIGSGGPFAFSSKLMYEGESVLLGRKGTIDKPLYIYGAFWAVDTMYWSIIKPGAHGRFVYYIATTIPFDMYSTNTALPSMTKGVLGSHIVAFPGFEEQQAIANHLDRETARIDALVERKNCFIKLLLEKRQALITQAVTKGLDPDVKMKHTGVEWLGEVPQHWDVLPLKSLVTFRSGGTPSKDNLEFWDGCIPWASAKDLKVEQLYDTQDHLTELAITSGAASLVSPGSILVVVRGMILARIFPVVEAMVPMAINQDLKALQASKKLESKFLANLLRGLADESLRRLEEAGHGTKALRMDAWTSMQITVPSIEEQRSILAYLDYETGRLDTLLSKTKRSIELLKERRSALIIAAVTGQIDLRETL